MQEMAERRLQPTIAAYSAYLKALSVVDTPSKLEKANTVLQWMNNADMKPNEVIHQHLESILAQEEEKS